MQWVMKKRSYWEFGELLNPGVKTLIYATDPKGTTAHKTGNLNRFTCMQHLLNQEKNILFINNSYKYWVGTHVTYTGVQHSVSYLF